jgi:TAG lipase/steryl ester hydrolase/phospholipase A2/LPA acyltransferase
MHRLQQLADTGVLPNLVTKGRSILSQRYSGDINIFPKINYADFPRVLTNPTPEFMVGCMLTTSDMAKAIADTEPRCHRTCIG